MNEMPEPITAYACANCGEAPATVGRLCAACDREYEPRGESLEERHERVIAAVRALIAHQREGQPGGSKWPKTNDELDRWHSEWDAHYAAIVAALERHDAAEERS